MERVPFLCALRTLREGYYYAESNFTLGGANRFLDNSSPHPIVRSTDPIVFHCGSIRKNQLSPGCSVFGDCRFSSSAGLDSPFFLLLQNLWFLLGFFKSPGRAGFFDKEDETLRIGESGENSGKILEKRVYTVWFRCHICGAEKVHAKHGKRKLIF